MLFHQNVLQITSLLYHARKRWWKFIVARLINDITLLLCCPCARLDRSNPCWFYALDWAKSFKTCDSIVQANNNYFLRWTKLPIMYNVQTSLSNHGRSTYGYWWMCTTFSHLACRVCILCCPFLSRCIKCIICRTSLALLQSKVPWSHVRWTSLE